MVERVDQHKLKGWFLDQRRDFPWRNSPSPYAVWVSEVMLQQTQASVVIPYFERWMRIFPSIQVLAETPLDIVIKEWEGLGYYSRARNLHQGARYVMQHHQGQLPASADTLKKIKGLGPYTIGAILSFAFHQRIEAVDGNVIRVLARYYGLQDDISRTATVTSIRCLAAALLPEEEPWIINEALIELGATFCGRRPRCGECPLKGSCRALALGKQDSLPVKSAKTEITSLYRAVAVVRYEDKLLVRRGAKGEIMSDLHEFPYIELERPLEEPKTLEQGLSFYGDLNASWAWALPEVRHSFTRYRARLYPHLFLAKKACSIPNYEWLDIVQLKRLAFSSGHRRILEQF